MARQLWFLRHGEAVPKDVKPDAERELTPVGERQSVAAGLALAELAFGFSACYTSPKVRARDTARLACRALGLEPVEDKRLGDDGFDRSDALELLGAHADDARILIVGHNPSFPQILYDLTGARVDLKKGGVAAVRTRGAGGELLVLLRPRELEGLAALAPEPAGESA